MRLFVHKKDAAGKRIRRAKVFCGQKAGWSDSPRVELGKGPAEAPAFPGRCRGGSGGGND